MPKDLKLVPRRRSNRATSPISRFEDLPPSTELSRALRAAAAATATPPRRSLSDSVFRFTPLFTSSSFDQSRSEEESEEEEEIEEEGEGSAEANEAALKAYDQRKRPALKAYSYSKVPQEVSAVPTPFGVTPLPYWKFLCSQRVDNPLICLNPKGVHQLPKLECQASSLNGWKVNKRKTSYPRKADSAICR